MTNEQYLIVSYFFVATLSVAIGAGVCLWLSRPVGETASALPWKTAGALIKRLFPVGILLPALLGFVSVTYKGCNLTEYEKIIADRSYLVAKNEQQLGATLTYLAWAILLWCALIAVLFALKRRFDRRRSS